jgi:hypothetical protein
MRKTIFTLVSGGRSSSKADGKQKTALSFALFFLFALMANQLQAQCSISCTNVNISVGMSCEADMHWDTYANLPTACNPNPDDEDFTLRVLDNAGNLIGESDSGRLVIDLHAYLNDSVMIEVWYDQGGPNANYCWTNALVEDKMPPMIQCVNDTVSCLDMLNEPFPIVTDNCSTSDEIETIVTNRTYVPVCDDDFIKLMIREWVAVDGSGNTSAPCTDTLWFERLDLSLVDTMIDYAGQNALECNGPWDMNGNDYPDVDETGVPTYLGQPLFPDVIESCNTQFTFSDVVFNIPCGTKVMRTWTGMEWCQGGDRMLTFVQVIEILDTEGPQVTAVNDNITVPTGIYNCEARVVIPAPSVDDNCSAIDRYVIATNAPAVPAQVYDAVVTADIVLPIGTWEVYLTAYDECYQNPGGSDTITVTVLDNTPPVAVCDEFTVVSLTSDGTAKIFAPTFDDGSHDECGPIDSIAVRRMDGECGTGNFDDFGPYVEFCCDDIGADPVMIIFKVIDQSGNENECMVEVEVQDKQPASIVAPDDITISCEFNFSMDDLSIFGNVVVLENLGDLGNPATDPRDSVFIDDPGTPFSGPEFKTLDGYAYDNCEVVITTDSLVDIETCGTGTIIRTFTAVGAGNTTQAVDQQVITIIDFDPFNAETINFPEDITLVNDCSLNGELTPEFLRDSLGFAHEDVFPTYDDDQCSQLARSYEDWFFPIDDPNDPACYKILRKWKILDWCTYVPGGDQPYEETQVIKVMNNVAPEFLIPCTDTLLLSIDGDCDSRYVELMQLAEDDCTPQDQLVYSYRIDAFNDGVFEPGLAGNTNDASAEYPVGEHLIEWTVEDQCGNRTTCSYLFEIESRKGPSPVCRNLTVELMPVDTDGDGTIDDGMLDIWASDFDLKSYHACGFPVTVSFSSNPLDTGRTFTCEDVGVVELELWVHASNGTSAFCRTYAIVQANNGACGPGNNGPTFPIAGNINNTSNASAMPNVDVELAGSTAMVETDTEGRYNFVPMPEGGNYEVMPKRNDDLLNGVSTIDVLFIQQHILGLNPLEGPAEMIAGDINNDGQISGSDIIAVRKAILGLEDEFPNNTSWRFVDAAFEFSANPLGDNFPESYVISNLAAPMTSINFDGIKIGDLNGNADETIDGRSGMELEFVAEDAVFETDELVRVPVTASNFDQVQAIQFSLNYDAQTLTFAGVESGAIELGAANIGDLKDQAVVTMSWTDVAGVNASDDDVLFTLIFKAAQSSTLAGALSMSDDVTEREAYAAGTAMGVDLSFRSTEATSEFALFQNSPNPFAGLTVIGFNLPERTDATLTVFDVTGKQLQVVEGTFEKGYNQIELNRAELNASGVMYYRLDAGDYSATKKMIVID